MRIYKYIAFALLFLVVVNAMGQRTRRENSYDSYPKNRVSLGGFYNMDTSSHRKLRYKSLTETKYTAQDSTLNHKRVDYKEIFKYNSHNDYIFHLITNAEGTILLKVEKKMDTLGRDTAVYEYNSDGSIKHKNITVFDDVNNTVENFTYDFVYSAGPTTTHTKSINNKNGQQIQLITYDAHEKVDQVEETTYDAKGRVLTKSATKKRITETGLPDDFNKTITYTTRYKYDTAGNTVETIKDSDGVVIYVETELYNTDGKEILDKEIDHGYPEEIDTIMYDKNGGNTEIDESFEYDNKKKAWKMSEVETIMTDAKDREVYDKDIEDGQVQEITSTVYDKEGGRTETDETFDYDDDNKSCGDYEKEVTVYDKHDNQLSDIDIDKSDGETDITESTTKYKFKNGKVISEITTEIEKGDGEYSKTVSSKTFTYDPNGNLIEKQNKGGGLYSSSDKDTYTYNSHNRMLVHQHYTACSNGTPDEIITKTYYSDGITVKDSISIHNYGTYKNKSITRYAENGLVTEEITTGESESSQTLYEYELW